MVTARLALLCAAMRSGGARVGIGELLSAHRAIRAVDASDRAASYFALRAVLCSRHEDLVLFDAAFGEAFAPPSGVEEPLLPDVARAVLPHVAVPQDRAAALDA